MVDCFFDFSLGATNTFSVNICVLVAKALAKFAGAEFDGLLT
jgi:hypothetical protein